MNTHFGWRNVFIFVNTMFSPFIGFHHTIYSIVLDIFVLYVYVYIFSFWLVFRDFVCLFCIENSICSYLHDHAHHTARTECRSKNICLNQKYFTHRIQHVLNRRKFLREPFFPFEWKTINSILYNIVELMDLTPICKTRRPKTHSYSL